MRAPYAQFFFVFASLPYKKYSVQKLSKPNSGEDYFLLLPIIPIISYYSFLGGGLWLATVVALGKQLPLAGRIDSMDLMLVTPSSCY